VTELERELLSLGRELEWPPVPAVDLGREQPRPSTFRMRRVVALAFALLVVVVGTAFAVPQSRDAILEWLGLQGATVERVVALPRVPVTADLALGQPVSLAEAQRRAGFEVLVPRRLGEPDEVFFDESTPGGRVSLVYRTDGEIGALVTEFPGNQAPELIGKLVAAGAVVENVRVNGHRGLWISGGRHVFFYRDPSGEVRDETLRLAANTLLFEGGDGVLVRIESRLDKTDMLDAAASMQTQ
jgi:hypothetical protein